MAPDRSNSAAGHRHWLAICFYDRWTAVYLRETREQAVEAAATDIARSFDDASWGEDYAELREKVQAGQYDDVLSQFSDIQGYTFGSQQRIAISEVELGGEALGYELRLKNS